MFIPCFAVLGPHLRRHAVPPFLVFGEPSSFEKWRGRSLEIASVVHVEPRFNRVCLSVSPAHAGAHEIAIDI